MTLKKAQRPADLGTVGTLPAEDVPLQPSIGETFGAAFRVENPIGSALSAGPRRLRGPRVPGYVPEDNIEGFENEIEAFREAGSPAHVEQIKSQIIRERGDRQLLEASGATGFGAGFVAGFTDPLILFPPARVVATGIKGVSALKAGLMTGVAGMTGAGASELALHSSQRLRTAEETAFNMTGATFLSGILGGTMAAVLARRARANAARARVPAPDEALADLGAAVERDLDPVDGVPDIRDDGTLGLSPEMARADTDGTHFNPPAQRRQDAAQGRADAAATARLGEEGKATEAAAGVVQDAVDTVKGSLERSGEIEAGDLNPQAQRQPGLPDAAVDAVKAAAREANPKLFVKVDGLKTQLNSIAGEFRHAIKARREQTSVPEIDVEIDALRVRQPTETPRNVKKLQKRIDALERAKDEALQEMRKLDTPEITTLRNRLVDVELKLRDLALDGSEAIRAARAKLEGNEAVDLSQADIGEAAERILIEELEPAELASRTIVDDELGAVPQTEPRQRAPEAEPPSEQAGGDIMPGTTGLGGRDADSAEVIQLSDVLAGRELPQNPTADQLPGDITTLDDIAAIDLDIPEAAEAGGSVGAAATTTLSEEAVRGAFGLEKATAFLAPGLRMLTSPFLASRKAAQELARSALLHEKNFLGTTTATPVEQLVDAHQFKLGLALQDLDRAYTEYRTGVTDGGRASRLRVQAGDVLAGGRDEGVLTFKQFRNEVSRAMRREDQHEIPAVQAAAQRIRRENIDPLKDKAIAAKMLSEDVEVETAASYLTRLYNTEKMVARKDEFVDIVTRWLVHRRDTVDIPKLREAEADAEHILQDGTRNRDLLDQHGRPRQFIADRAGMEDQELASVAEEIFGRIVSTPAGRLPYDAHIGRPSKASFLPNQNARGPLARRSFLIPDELIEEFLENDIDVVLRSYYRTMAPDVEIATRFGDVDMTPQMKAIQDDADAAGRLVTGNEELSPRQKERARTRINKRKDADIRDLAGMRDRLKGIHGMPENPNGVGVRTLRVAREVNLVSKLGGMTISALPDVFRPVMQEGLENTLRHAVLPLISNLKGFRLARNEVKELAAISEMLLNTRVATIADIGDDFGRHTVGERALGAATDSFGLVSGMSPWNQFWKELGGTVSMGRILTEAGNWRAGNISPTQIAKLAASGIDEGLAVRIANEFDRHGINDRGVKQAGTENWKDRGAAEAMQNALQREVANTIVTPGIGDQPLWKTSTQLGRNIGQFKSFMFAAHQAVLLSGLQRRDAAALNGLVLSVAMGMMTYYFKQKMAEREISDDPAVWIAEGIDRSGVTGVFFDFNNIMEKVGVNTLPGGPTRSRYQSRNVVGALLGPTFGQATDIAQIVGSSLNGDIRASDTRALRRMLPYQNLFYIRNILNRAEEGVNDAFNLPETSRRRRKKQRRRFDR